MDNEGVVHYGEVCVQRGYHSHRFFYVSNLFAIGRTTGDTYGGRHILLSARNTHPGGPKGRNAKEIERIAWTATGSSGVTFWHFFAVHRNVNANGETVVSRVDISIGCE